MGEGFRDKVFKVFFEGSWVFGAFGVLGTRIRLAGNWGLRVFAGFGGSWAHEVLAAGWRLRMRVLGGSWNLITQL